MAYWQQEEIFNFKLIASMVKCIFVWLVKIILVVFYFEMLAWERKVEGREAYEKATMGHMWKIIELQ